MNPRTPASRWRRLLKLKRKKNSIKIIIGFFFTPPLFLETNVAISFVYFSPKTIKCTRKPKIEKKFTGIDRSSERASATLRIKYLQLALAHARNSRAEKGYSWHFEAILSEMPKKLGTSKYFYRLRGGGGVDFAGLRGF